MTSSIKLALSVLFRGIRSTGMGRNLKDFILRCQFLWPRILRSLRKVWSSYFQTSSSHEKNTKGDPDTGGPSSAGALRKREECVVVCASQAFGKVPVGEPSGHFMSGSSDAEPSIPMEDVIRRNPSVSHSLSSRAPSRQGSPGLLAPPPTHRPSTPVNWTHSRATGRQFTGVSSRSHSRPSSPSPFLRRPSRPNTPTRSDVDIPTRPATIRHLLGSEGSPSDISIDISGPSRPGTPEDSRNVHSFSPPQFPSVTADGPTQSLSTHHRLPSAEFVNPSADSRGHSLSGYGAHVGAHENRESIRPEGSMTSRSTQAPPRPSFRFLASFRFPEPSISGISTQSSTMDVTNSQFRPGMPPVRPMNSDQVSRYLKKGDVPQEDSEFLLYAMQVKLRHSRQPEFCSSGDWTPIMHPGGALYFYHEEKRIFTDVYMYDSSLREEVQKSAGLLDEKLTELEYQGVRFPTGDYDLVLDIVETKDKKTTRQYYFVDHNTRTLFWLEDYDMSLQLDDILGAKEPGHIKLYLESLYWLHWSLYPVGYKECKFPDDASKELLGILLSNSIDSLTCKVSTALYSVADMQTMREVIKEAEDLGLDDPHAINSIARLLSICVQWRFVHFHGQKTSRQSIYKSIYKDSFHKRTKVFRLLSLTLFFTPDVHLRELKRVWADEIVIEEIWRNFIQKLVSEWVEFVLYSTVMLAANVGFLATPGVIVVPTGDSKGWIRASPAQIASSMSLVFSIGSIIAGLLLIRRNRTMGTQDSRTACDYLDSMTWRHFYLEPLAVLFSLTYALLMWSVCVFFAALLLFSFQNATTHIRACVGAASGIVTVLIVWCVINCWDSDCGKSEKDGVIDIPSEEDEPRTI